MELATTPLDFLLASTPAELVFMDCDGVIYDTNALKCDAFRYALEDYPKAVVETLVAYHQATGGVSRYLKLERFFREMLPVAEPEGAMRRALLRFADFCEHGYERMRPRSEALAFAGAMGGADRVHVVSGSDEGELRKVFEAAQVRDRFAEIHGSPVGKRAHLLRICAERGVELGRCLFVGDGWGDWDTATALEVPFVFLSEMSEWDGGHRTIAAAEGSTPVAEATSWEALLQAMRRAAKWTPKSEPR